MLITKWSRSSYTKLVHFYQSTDEALLPFWKGFWAQIKMINILKSLKESVLLRYDTLHCHQRKEILCPQYYRTIERDIIEPCFNIIYQAKSPFPSPVTCVPMNHDAFVPMNHDAFVPRTQTLWNLWRYGEQLSWQINWHLENEKRVKWICNEYNGSLMNGSISVNNT